MSAAREAGDGGEGARRERLPEDGGILHERAIRRIDRVEAGRDQRVQRRRHRELAERPDRLIAALLTGPEPTVRHEHPDRLDGVQGDPLGTGDDRADRRFRQVGHEPPEEVPHRALVERLEVEGEERPLARAPVRPALEQLRARERDDHQRDVPAPLEHVLDEVQGAGVRPVEVLEQQRDDARAGQPLEERPPGGEQLRGAAGGHLAHAEQGQQRGLDPPPLRVVGDVRRHHLGDPGPGRRGIVRLEQVGPGPDHLAQGPERDPLAVGRRPALVPPHPLDDAVDVLEELPGEAALADPGLARDRDEPDPLLARRRVEQVLEQPQLGVAPDERRLEALVPATTAALGDDAHRPPRGNRRFLALEHLLAGGLVRDRADGCLLGRLADEDGARRRHRLEPRGGVHEVARDHALVLRPEGDRGLAGQHAAAGLDARAQPRHDLDQLEAGADRSLGIVLVRGRGAPHGHHRVADELLDRPAVAPDRLATRARSTATGARGRPRRRGPRRAW